MCSNYCKREKEMGTRIKEYKYEVCSKETDIQYRRVVPSVVRFPDPLVYPTNQTTISSEFGEPDYTIGDNGENFCSEAFLDSNKLTRSGNTRFKIAEEVRFTLFVQNTTIADTTNTWSARNLLISRDESLRRMDCSGD